MPALPTPRGPPPGPMPGMFPPTPPFGQPQFYPPPAAMQPRGPPGPPIGGMYGPPQMMPARGMPQVCAPESDLASKACMGCWSMDVQCNVCAGGCITHWLADLLVPPAFALAGLRAAAAAPLPQIPCVHAELTLLALSGLAALSHSLALRPSHTSKAHLPNSSQLRHLAMYQLSLLTHRAVGRVGAGAACSRASGPRAYPHQ